MNKIEYDESMLEEEKINRFLNMIAIEYDGGLARDFQNLYIKKEKEADKYKEVLDKIKEYIENLLKEELEITDTDSTMFGEKCQRKFFSDSELEKILELLEETE